MKLGILLLLLLQSLYSIGQIDFFAFNHKNSTPELINSAMWGTTFKHSFLYGTRSNGQNYIAFNKSFFNWRKKDTTHLNYHSISTQYYWGSLQTKTKFANLSYAIHHPLKNLSILNFGVNMGAVYINNQWAIRGNLGVGWYNKLWAWGISSTFTSKKQVIIDNQKINLYSQVEAFIMKQWLFENESSITFSLMGNYINNELITDVQLKLFAPYKIAFISVGYDTHSMIKFGTGIKFIRKILGVSYFYDHNFKNKKPISVHEIMVTLNK